MSDSFTHTRATTGSNKPVVVGGIVVLVVAALAALAAGWIALSLNDDSPAASAPTTVTVTATPEEPGFDAAEFPAGTYVGMLTSVGEDSEGRTWQAVATFGDGTAMISYPDQACTVALAPLTETTFSSTPLSKHCTGTEGTWSIAVPESGLVELTYSINGVAEVEGTLSYGTPKLAESVGRA